MSDPQAQYRTVEPSLQSIILWGGISLIIALIVIFGVSELGVAGSSSFH